MTKITTKEVNSILWELARKNNTPKKFKGDRKAVLAMKIELCDFAQEHKLVISPNGCEYYIESYLMFDCCPCDKNRSHCPCPESIMDIEQMGHCLCKLFWQDYRTFQEQMLSPK